MDKNKMLIVFIISFLGISFIMIGIFLNSKEDTSIKNESLTKTIIYEVKEGETLDYISFKHNMKIEELIKYNNLSKQTVKIGQKLKIPNVYVYKIGNDRDLFDVSSKFGVYVGVLKEINELKDYDISNKKELIIPNVNIYKIKKGDTLKSISNQFNVGKEAILKLNKIKNNDIIEDKIIVIPKNSFQGFKPGDIVTDLTDEENTIYNKYYFIGVDLYKNKSYLNFKQVTDKVYYLTIKDLTDLGYDTSDILKKCSMNDILISFDDKNKDKFLEEPISLNFNCNKVG